MTTTVDTPATTEVTVQLPNVKVNYATAGDGPPLVLLHGSGPGATGLTNYSDNIGPLAERFRVVAPSMPGWGKSDTPVGPVGRDHVQVLIDLLDELGIDRAAVVGNSMGGMTAISTAIRHPERVSHLITMGAPAPVTLISEAGDGWSEGMKVLMKAYREPTPDTMHQLLQIMVFDQRNVSAELALERSRAAFARPDHLQSWNAMFDGEPAPNPYFATMGPRLRSITAPTLVVHGRDDRVVSFEHGLHLVRHIADSRLLLINRCGHWAQIEHAAEFNRAVVSFVAG